jgi:hypothetical protein
MTDAAAETLACAVCGGRMSAAMSAECNWCDRRYHLNQRNDMPDAKDCGQVWIDEQFLALQFACNDCLANDSQPGPAPAPAPQLKPVRLNAPRTARRRYRKRS